jgi:hypothetical protein
MALYIPPVRQHSPFHMKWLILLVGTLLLLFGLFLLSVVDTPVKQRIIPDWAVAAASLVEDPIDKIKHTNQPEGTKRHVSMTAPITTQFTASVKITPLEAALTDLLKGPSTSEIREGRYSEIPKGTQLLGVSVSNNTVLVNLSEEFASGGGSTSMIERVEELKATIKSIDSHYKLKIAINGQPIPYLGGEGLEL